MRCPRVSLWCALVLLSSTPGWSADKQPAEKSVKGKLVSVEDNGMGHTITVETAEGKKVAASMDPGSAPPEDVKAGDAVEMTYAEVTTPRVSALRLTGGPKFKKKPASSAQGTLVGYSSGDMGDYIVLDKGGQQQEYLADFGVLTEENVGEYKGKKVEVALYGYTTSELHELKRQRQP